MWVIWVFWHLWKHWPDIVNTRKLLDWTRHSLVWIWEWDTMPTNLAMAVVFVNISRTSTLVEELIHLWIPIINCCGIMSTTPRSSWNDVTNIHFLFWPWAKQDLKLAIAGRMNPPTVSQIIHNAWGQSIRIIETCQEEHDRAMAVIQALTHLAIILHDLNVNTWKICPQTEASTIADMIQCNPYFKEVYEKFSARISKWMELGEAFRQTVEELEPQWKTNGKKFTTPNFDLIQQRSQLWNIHVGNDKHTWLIQIPSKKLQEIILQSRGN